MPTALATQYCTRSDVESVLSVAGVALRLDDDQNATESATETAYLTTQGLNWATSKVNDYCEGRYDIADLAANWTVNEWASILAARWLCLRRCNPIPESVQALYEEAVEQLQQVKAGQYDLGDAAERTTKGPAWSNLRLSLHRVRKLRVERPISEKTPPKPAGNRTTDYEAEFVGPETY